MSVINIKDLLSASKKPTAPPRPQLSPQQEKALHTLKSLAANNATTIDVGRRTGSYQTWSAIESVTKTPTPPEFKTDGDRVTLLKYIQWRSWYVGGAEERFLDSMRATAFATPTPEAKHVEVKTTGWSLKPQQRKGVDMIVSLFTSADPAAPRACILPWATGRGKTFAIGGAILALKQEGKIEKPRFPLFPPVLYLTKNRVVRSTKRKLEMMGLSEKDVLVLSYSALNTKRFKPFFAEDVEVRYGQQTKVYRWAALPFQVIILDECQDVKNPDAARTKRVEGLFRAHDADKSTRAIFASATPFVTLEDTRMFCLAARFQFAGAIVNNDTFMPFVRQFVYAAGGKIDKPNAAALARFKDHCGAAIVMPPNDPVKTKVYNTVKLIDFASEDDRRMYKQAEQAYIDAVEAAGGDARTSQRGEILRAFTIYARAEELCKCDYFAAAADQHVRDGNSAVICVRFQDSVITTAGKLAKLGYTRNDISIIWGGRQIIKESDCFTTEEFMEITLREKREAEAARELELDDPTAPRREKLAFLSKKDRTKYKKTAIYAKERLFKGESKSQARERVAWLENMMLRPQDEAAQDIEVENFLAGKTKICIFTMSAGGIGIDLDHQRPTAFPRRGELTVCYWAEEFVQAAGRDWRPASSITDTYNNFVFIRNTLASDHIAPKLAKKVTSINAIGASGIDFEELLTNAVAKKLAAEKLDETAPPEGSDEEIDESIIDIEDNDDDE
jgi:hypothetical protein